MLDAFRLALDGLRRGAIDTPAFCAQVRALALPPQLPARFGVVLGDLLDRFESSALFSGESCSFSQEDLMRHLDTWLEKAQARLAA